MGEEDDVVSEEEEMVCGASVTMMADSAQIKAGVAVMVRITRVRPGQAWAPVLGKQRARMDRWDRDCVLRAERLWEGNI